MSKKPKQKNDYKNIGNKRISKDYNNNLDSTDDHEDSFVRFSFSTVCPNYCLLENWLKEDLRMLNKVLISASLQKWSTFQSYHGFNLKIVKKDSIKYKLPDGFPPDSNLIEFRVSIKRRLFGYRVGNTFYFIWFDKNHEVCPD